MMDLYSTLCNLVNNDAIDQFCDLLMITPRFCYLHPDFIQYGLLKQILNKDDDRYIQCLSQHLLKFDIRYQLGFLYALWDKPHINTNKIQYVYEIIKVIFFERLGTKNAICDQYIQRFNDTLFAIAMIWDCLYIFHTMIYDEIDINYYLFSFNNTYHTWINIVMNNNSKKIIDFMIRQDVEYQKILVKQT